MARIYAGILGPLALLTSLVHGLIHARQTEAILSAAWSSLLVFSAIGFVVGWIAGRIVEESVTAGIRAELAVRETSNAAEPPSPPT